MRRGLLIVAMVFVLIFGGGVAAAYAFDASRQDLIAEGVTAAGIDLGGLRANQARARLEREVLEPLEETIRIRVPGRDRAYALSARRSRIRADIEGTVQAALAHSRNGTLVTRTLREVQDERVEADLPLDVTYSRRAVTRLVDQIEDDVRREPRDASVNPTTTTLERVRARNGRALRSKELSRRIRAALVRPDASRTVRARTRALRPEVTTAKLAEKYPTYLTVDRAGFRLRLFKGLEEVKSYRIAVGQAGLETPAGTYDIQNKAVDPDWLVPDSDWAGDKAGELVPGGTEENPLKARWMGIYDGAGIHGTSEVDSLGTNASHGCIRMAVPDVKELYDRVPVGTPVFIA